MKKYVFYFLLISFLTNCTASKNDEKAEINLSSEEDEKRKLDEEIEKNGKVISKQIAYDWDKNKMNDTFLLTYFDEVFIAKINGRESKTESTGTSFGSLSEKGFALNNKIKDSTFIFINFTPDQEHLILKDRGDFGGSILNIFNLENDKVNKIWEGFGEIIELKDLDEDESPEIVLKDIVSDPGSIEGYDYINFAMFRVYKYQDGNIHKDSTLSVKYNLEYTPDFQETLGMQTPVRARKHLSNSNGFDLIIDIGKQD
ncbi:MAG: hypothetical protein NVV82_29600 [Sporocytophaga sp.]|nr:hypothetical protein [Sporocytophaga sp.]